MVVTSGHCCLFCQGYRLAHNWLGQTVLSFLDQNFGQIDRFFNNGNFVWNLCRFGEGQNCFLITNSLIQSVLLLAYGSQVFQCGHRLRAACSVAAGNYLEHIGKSLFCILPLLFHFELVAHFEILFYCLVLGHHGLLCLSCRLVSASHQGAIAHACGNSCSHTGHPGVDSGKFAQSLSACTVRHSQR